MKKTLSFLLLLCVSMSIWAQRVINLNDETVDVRSRVASVNIIPQEFLSEAKASRTFAINPVLQNSNNVSVGDIINLQLFEGQSYTATISDTATNVNGNFTIKLKLTDYPMSFGFITTNREGKSLFSVSIPEHNQKFTSRGSIDSQASFLIEIDGNINLNLDKDYKEIPTLTPMDDDGENHKTGQFPQRAQAPTTSQDPVNCTRNPNLTGTDPATIDVLVVYTPAAATWAAQNEGGITNTIAGAMTYAKAVVDNQRNGDRIVLAHSQQINYTEFALNEMNTDLDRLTNTNDGYMDEVHQLRKQHNADLVVLLGVYNNPGGLAWVLSNSEEGRVDYGFSITRVQQASWTYTFIHEIGHNMGMLHNVEDNSSTPLYPYAFGWHWRGSSDVQFGSVMSYPGQRVPYFSNPNETHDGVATGTSTANNARVFRDTKHIIAFYSNKLHSIPGVPANVVVSNPTNHGATFSWDAVDGATEYRVIGPNGWFFRTSNTIYTINNSGENWFPLTCTTYQFSIQAVNACGDVGGRYSSTFRTFCPATDPVVTTLAATNLTTTTATLNRTVTPASAPVIAQGFMYKARTSTDWLTSTTGNLTGLTLGTEYEFYALATTASNTFHGSTLTFRTPACDISAPTNIVVSTPIDNGATFSWDTVDGAVEYHVIYSGSFYTTSNTTFTVNWSGWFSPCTTYDVTIRAQAECGERASSTITFTTRCAATDPTVTTLAANNITYNSATLNRTVTPAIGTPVLSQGFMYKEISAATWQTSIDGSLTGLTPNTQYKFYAYATTALGTFNGRVLEFTTSAYVPPLLSFGIKWSEADEIIHPTGDNNSRGTITFQLLSTDRNQCHETYFTLEAGFEDCVLYLNGELLEVGLDMQGIESAYFCYGNVSSGWLGKLEIVRLTSTKSIDDGTVVATYDLIIGGVTTGVQQLETSVAVYPNPTTGIINISREANLKLLTLQGILLKETFGKQIDLSGYPQGSYLLQVDDKVLQVVKK